MMDGMLELLSKSVFASRSVIVFEIKSHKLRPWQLGFRFRRMNVWREFVQAVLIVVLRVRLRLDGLRNGSRHRGQIGR